MTMTTPDLVFRGPMAAAACCGAALALAWALACWRRCAELRARASVVRVTRYDLLLRDKTTIYRAGWLRRAAAVLLGAPLPPLHPAAFERTSWRTVYEVARFGGDRALVKDVAAAASLHGPRQHGAPRTNRFRLAYLDYADVTAFLNARRVEGLTVPELAKVCLMEGWLPRLARAACPPFETMALKVMLRDERWPELRAVNASATDVLSM